MNERIGDNADDTGDRLFLELADQMPELRQMRRIAEDAARRGGFIDRPALLDRFRGAWSTATQPERDATRVAQTPPPKKPQAHTRQVIRSLAPSVKERRERLFGTTEAPSTTLAEAAAWLEGRTMRQAPIENIRDYHAARAPIQHAVTEFNATQRWYSATWRAESRYLEYWQPDGTIGRRAIAKDDKVILEISTWAEDAARASGILSASLIAWLLTDVAPDRQTIVRRGRRVALPIVRGIVIEHRGARIALDFDPHDLTDRGSIAAKLKIQDWRAAARRYRRANQLSKNVADAVS
jgi:hypothetical protein